MVQRHHGKRHVASKRGYSRGTTREDMRTALHASPLELRESLDQSSGAFSAHLRVVNGDGEFGQDWPPANSREDGVDKRSVLGNKAPRHMVEAVRVAFDYLEAGRAVERENGRELGRVAT